MFIKNETRIVYSKMALMFTVCVTAGFWPGRPRKDEGSSEQGIPRETNNL